MNPKLRVLLTIAVLIVIALILYFIANGITTFTGFTIKPSQENLDKFAQCLTEKGIKMYGSIYCSHCKAQKDLFGTSFQYINYTECTENPNVCIDLVGVPAWEINGKITYGTQSLQKLAELSGCKLQ